MYILVRNLSCALYIMYVHRIYIHFYVIVRNINVHKFVHGPPVYYFYRCVCALFTRENTAMYSETSLLRTLRDLKFSPYYRGFHISEVM